MRLRQTVLPAWLAAGLVGLGTGPAAGQSPTPEQATAIRQACRADYMQRCAGVPTGGKEALACLMQNRARVSRGCQDALGAVQPRPQNQTTAPATTGWPRTVTEGAASLVIYQPQVTAWPEHATLRARAAVELHRSADAAPVLGTIEFEAATRTDVAQRQVTVSDVRVLGTHFPALDTGEAAQLEARMKAAAAGLEARSVPLDSVLASVQDAPATAKPVATDDTPPVIFYSPRPARLVVFDGEPVLAPIPQAGLSMAVNTNWSVLTDPASGQWYLLENGAWLSAPAYGGPYQRAGALPPSFGRIPEQADYADIRRNVPGRHITAQDVPAVFVSTRPATIVVTEGPPKLAPIAGTRLQIVTNTGADLVADPDGRRFYLLVSGRWFSAAALEGPWRYATPELPAEFASIPPDGPQGRLLASVPGTVAAQQAVIAAQIPHQATLKRDATIQVSYVGTPEFRPIPGTPLRYAVNTPAQVIEAEGRYYACVDGAWFVAAAPTGPWVLADAVPPAIYTIPPSSPLHDVVYVRVYSATPEAVVVGYTAGYAMGIVAAAGVVVYGTGYVYPPVVVPGPVPAYLPYPYTYAGGVRYNPATGAWGRGGAVYGPYGGAGAWSAYNPQTGAYAHGSAAWGPGGGNAYASFGNPATGRSGSTSQGWNPYERWGSSTISGPNQTVHTESAANARGSAGAFSSSTGAEGAAVRGAGGNNAAVVKGAGGDVYAGHDGNAYRHTDDGWSKWGNGGWQPVTPPSSGQRQPPAAPAAQGQRRPPGGEPLGSENFQQLERDRQARWQGFAGQRGAWEGRREGFEGHGFEGGRFRR